MPSRPLPAANYKGAGFAVFRAHQSKKARPSASGPASSPGSATAPPPVENPRPKPIPKGINASAKKKDPPPISPDTRTRRDPDDPANVSHSPIASVSEPRGGKKRKLDEMDAEVIVLDSDEDLPGIPSTEVVNSEGLNNTEVLNKACTLVRGALAKVDEGEKERLRLENSLRQRIAFLESELQQEKSDHERSKRRIRDLEGGLLEAASSMKRTNSLLQSTCTQLVHAYTDVGRGKE